MVFMNNGVSVCMVEMKGDSSFKYFILFLDSYMNHFKKYAVLNSRRIKINLLHLPTVSHMGLFTSVFVTSV
jgi:hypothetical protein